MSNQDADTFPMTLAGREILFRRAGLGQVIMLQRIATRRIDAARNGPDEQQAQAIASALKQTLDFIETLVVEPDDLEFIEENMVLGKIEWSDLVAALGGGKDTKEPEDDQAPEPVRRVPKKSPKAVRVARP